MSGYDICVIGSSWGGLQALEAVLRDLEPPSFAIAVVQHRSADAPDSGLPSYYASRTRMKVRSIDDKEPLELGTVYIAPPDYHVLVEPGFFSLSLDDVVQFSRPSIDVLFESAAEAYGSRTIGVLLTGANEDGAAGLGRIREVGGMTIVQDPATAARATMPAAAVAAGAAKLVLPLEEIGRELARLGAE